MAQNQQLHTDITDMPPVNRRYKDSLFRIAFRGKKELLELYNAINGSDYNNPDELTIYTLEDIVFMNIKNDISFLVGEMLNLYEHQSTRNPNMPIRGLLYFARNYESYISRQNLDIYSSSLQRLPFPQYYVLYNGTKDEKDRHTIRLEDAFPDVRGIEPCLKCTATLLNINYGHNHEIMAKSKTLNDYANYVQHVRTNLNLGMPISQAVERATDDCIKEDILRDILLKNQAEVKNMVLGAWGTENHLRQEQKERERLAKEIETLSQEKIVLKQQTTTLRQQTASLRQQTASLQQQTASLQQQTASLQQQTTSLQQQTASLQQQTASLEQRQAALNLLTQKLISLGKIDELNKSSMDKVYQTRLLKEYHLI